MQKQQSHRNQRRIVSPKLLGLALVGVALGCGDDGGSSTGSGSSSDASSDDGSNPTDPTSDDSTSTSDDSTSGPDDSGDTGSSSESGDSSDAIDRVLAYMGGADALQNLSGFEAVSQGERFVPGEGFLPSDDPLPANTFEQTLRADVAGDRLRIDTARNVVVFGLDIDQTYSEIIDGTLGVVDGVESLFGFPTGAMLSDRWAAVRRQQTLLNPHALLQGLAADPSIGTVLDPETIDGTVYDVIELPDPVAPLRLYADPQTGEPRRLVTLENDPMHRDVDLVVTYDDWPDAAGGIPHPAHVTLSRHGELLHDEQRASFTTDPTLGDELFEFPPELTPAYVEADAERGLRSHQFHQVFASIGIPLDGLQTLVNPVQLAPGVWHVRGGSHHSMVVEQQDGVVLIEAPLYPQRSIALMEWIEQQIPSKPITHVVITHFHEDHAAGAREVLATGATLVVGAPAEAFWDEVLEAPSTIVPDALAGSGIEVPVELVPTDGEFTIPDATNPVLVVPVIGNTHAVDLISPVAGGALFIADIYSPGNPAFAATGAAELYGSIVDQGLEDAVDSIVGAHGEQVHTLQQLAEAAGN